MVYIIMTKYIIQILSSQLISSCAIFRHFYQVNFFRKYIVNRKDEVGLHGVHGDSYADENCEEVVVVEQHGILIG